MMYTVSRTLKQKNPQLTLITTAKTQLYYEIRNNKL